MTHPTRILLAKPGLDGHDRGIKVIAHALRDAGFEVIYMGLHRTPAQIARSAIDEDVALVGLSCLSGAHLHLFGEVIGRLDEFGGGIPVFVGGIIPDEDIPALKKMGVREVFLPGTPLADIVGWARANAAGAAALQAGSPA